MTIRKLEKSDYKLIADLTHKYKSLIDVLGFEHISEWLVSILKKPFCLVYEDGDNKGFIVPEKLSHILFAENEQDTIGNLEVIWYMIPYNKAVEVEYYTVLPGLFKAFTEDKIKTFNVLEGFQEDNGTEENSQSDTECDSSDTIEDSSSDINSIEGVLLS